MNASGNQWLETQAEIDRYSLHSLEKAPTRKISKEKLNGEGVIDHRSIDKAKHPISCETKFHSSSSSHVSAAS